MKRTKKIMATVLATLATLSLAGCNLADETEKVGNVVVSAYQSVENFFVDGFHKVTNVFVGAYQSVEDKCVEWFFAKDGETVEQAKDRLNQTK